MATQILVALLLISKHCSSLYAQEPRDAQRCRAKKGRNHGQKDIAQSLNDLTEIIPNVTDHLLSNSRMWIGMRD